MSGLKNIQCELPTKPWNDYSSDEIRQYCFRNLKYTDCSFVGEDQEDIKTGKVYKSFKWILCDLSPVLTEILNDVKNQAKDWKEIVVSDPKYIEATEYYGHMKILDTKIVNLVDFYGASKQYQIQSLKDEVIKILNSEGIPENADWVKLFWLSYVKYPEDQQMRAVFEKIRLNDAFVEMNTNFILEFNEKVFDIFFNLIIKRGVPTPKCFKVMEAYLTEHLLDGDKEKSIEDLGITEKGLVEFYVEKLPLWLLCFEELTPYFSSKVLPKIIKIEIFKKMRKRYGSGNPKIEEYLKKLQAE